MLEVISLVVGKAVVFLSSPFEASQLLAWQGDERWLLFQCLIYANGRFDAAFGSVNCRSTDAAGDRLCGCRHGFLPLGATGLVSTVLKTPLAYIRLLLFARIFPSLRDRLLQLCHRHALLSCECSPGLFLIWPCIGDKWGTSFLIAFCLRIISALLYLPSSHAPHGAFLRELNSFACRCSFSVVVARYPLNALRSPKVATGLNFPVLLPNFK